MSASAAPPTPGPQFDPRYLVKSENGTLCYTGVPDKPEPERPVRIWIGLAGVKARFGWDAEQLRIACDLFKFPAPLFPDTSRSLLGRTIGAMQMFSVSLIPRQPQRGWYEDEIDAWEEALSGELRGLGFDCSRPGSK